MMKGFIAIDGGGSKTEYVLVNELGNILLHRFSTCTNPNDVGMEISLSILESNINEMLAFAKNSNLNIQLIFLAIAGIEFGDSKDVLKTQLLKSVPVDTIYVDGDLASVKELGLGNDTEGVVIISGTGFNMAIKKNNKYSSIGGWGYLADDYLSGFDLGKEALVRCSRAIDMVDEPTMLVKMIEEKFANRLWYDMAEIYQSGIKGVASLSKIVVQAYKLKDKVAMEIVDKRVNNLSNILKEKTKDMTSQVKVCLFGGIFENNDFIVEKIKLNLGEKFLVNVTKKKTIYGTVYLAKKALSKGIDEVFLLNFDNSYREVQS